jgi:cell division protease FtsH
VTGLRKLFKSAAFLVALAALAITVGAGVLFTVLDTSPETIPLSQAVTLINDGQVQSAQLNDSASTVLLTQKSGTQVEAVYPEGYSETLTNQLITKGVDTEATTAGWRPIILQFSMTMLPLLILLGALYYFLKSGALGGMGDKGKQLGEVPDVTFADVAGCDEAVADLKEMTEFLRAPERFHKLGATVPRGALLTGPPGTGKTLLARAVAGEAQVPFYAVAGSDFVEMFAGRGASRVRKLFESARKQGKGIVFIDEIDAVGRKRSSGALTSSGDSEREGTLVALLNEMDGFKSTGVIVLAATNRSDTLDEALTRPGRMDRSIQVNPPDRRGRVDVLKVHVRGKAMSDDLDLNEISLLTAGMVGAELAMVVNEACIEAARRDSPVVQQVDLTNAVQIIQIGRPRTSALVTPRDRQITAYHEAGHAVAAELLDNIDGPTVVSIIPRGQTGGATYFGGNDDNFLTVNEAHDRLVTMMGGRVGEMLFLGESNFTQGAAHDFEAATRLSYAMITKFGMDPNNLATLDADSLRLGSDMAVRAHDAANGYIEQALGRAKEVLLHGPGKEMVLRLVEILLVDETVYREQLDGLRDEVLGTNSQVGGPSDG